MKLQREDDFFKFVHSAGELERCNSKNLDNRRIYTDLETNTIYSVNTQYGGNTIGPKKLGMRLGIRKASKEGWLTEHMFIMGVHGPRERISYFAGAYPSACGKTSTSMIEGETLVGDDIAYLREIGGELRAVNPERGIFGIIRDVNPEDDPLIWKALRKPGEVIVSNVLVRNGRPYWIGMGEPLPEMGTNHSGKWWMGKKDDDGNEIGPAHLNARYTLKISDLDNMDVNLENPEGIKLDGIIYGARDADTWLPVEEAFDWEHGVLTKGAILESETTSATLGKSGLRTFNPMANIDFLSIPIGEYLENHIRIGKRLRNPPRIFSANYFLKDEQGNFLNNNQDKRVWLKWMELRVHADVGAMVTPTGLAPTYEDLRILFRRILGCDYSQDEYDRQFKIRVRENLMKIDRMIELYENKIVDVPQVLSKALQLQKARLEEARREFGDYMCPSRCSNKKLGAIQEVSTGDVEAVPQQVFQNQSCI
jgi:phosphoenolpyruvate carboxykinase (GTP)